MGDGIFSGFGVHRADGGEGASASQVGQGGEAQVAEHAGEQAPQGPPADAPIASVPADAPTVDEQTGPAAAPEIVPGVPLWTFENPYGDNGLSWLADLDLEARHEANQPAQHPGTDTTEARPLTRSGGAAYYVNLITGRGFSVPINAGTK